MPDQRCKGDLHSGARCKLSRVRRNEPISIRGPCDKCHERRCKTHCRCGRTGMAKGRSAPRPAQRQEVVRQVQAPQPAAAPAGPVGRPASLGLEVLCAMLWWQGIMQAVESATSEIVVASYMFDHAALTHALVCRLSRQAALSVSVLVDLAAFNERTSRHQRPRLVALRNAGANRVVAPRRVACAPHELQTRADSQRTG